jgi:cytochrome P450
MASDVRDGGRPSSTAVQVPHAGEVCPYAADAYPDVTTYFRDLRAMAPVHCFADGTFALSRYEDVFAALTDPETFSSSHPLQESSIDLANSRSVIYSDDPVHLGLRQLVNRAFTPRAVLELRPKIQGHVEAAFASVEPGREFDVLELGTYIAFHTFADAFGLPDDQHERVRAWSTTAMLFVRPNVLRPAWAEWPDAQLRGSFDPGYADLRAHLLDLGERHAGKDAAVMQAEGVPPLARAIALAVNADPENLDEILHRILPPLHAGGTSTVNHLFPNVVDALIEQPEAWQRLKDDPAQLDPESASETLEELIRLRGVVQGIPRVAARDVEVRGTVIPKGSIVHLYYLSGSLDDEAFPDAEQFHPRGISRHLGFGFGTHTCIGQSLVRLELKLFLSRLVQTFSAIQRANDDPLLWGSLGVYYTPPTLPIRGTC